MVALTVLWPQHTVMATLGFLALANPLKGRIPSVLPFPLSHPVCIVGQWWKYRLPLWLLLLVLLLLLLLQ